MREWRETTVSEIIKLVGGGTPKTKTQEYWNGNIPWLSVVDFNTGNKFVFETEKKITQAGLENSSTQLLEIGDVIISARGTVGVVAMLGKQMAFNHPATGLKQLMENQLIIMFTIYLRMLFQIFFKYHMEAFLTL